MTKFNAAQAAKLLDIRDVSVSLNARGKPAPSVLEGISLAVGKGEIVGVVGESGCGKSVLSLSVLGLLPGALRLSGGEIEYAGVHRLDRMGQDELRRYRGKEAAMIFQDPMSSLNPGLTIGAQLTEMIRLHLGYGRKEASEWAGQLLHKVGLPRPASLLREYPHRLSGGMRQRVMIAMAMSCNPGLLIADEPTTALDVTIQAQILEMMRGIREENGTSIMLISHDLGVIADMSDRIAVMYAGQIVEEGDARDIFDRPAHPYTIGLLNAIPSPAKKREKLFAIPGTVPALEERGRGCRFAPRCPHAEERCRAEAPPLVRVRHEHRARCFLAEEKGATAHEPIRSGAVG
ncbi:ABC transporter ATP-binding protein [Paenibacillus xanthanilyticus]|uniref:ABC transporter ATP-binding protein n=1 Tax=Paenibacillus xanthanilyticus TaxID=1783531 RepID=A0ABV8K6G3_9BACL